jgi:hydrogenase-1 operon protein HyaE
MNPLERLQHHARIEALDADGLAAFAHVPAPGLLLVPGDPSRPEATDVAVVLGELAERFPRLRVAVAPEGHEQAMRAQLGVTAFPALLFVKGGRVVTTLARMQAWSAYESAARELEVS